MVARRVVEDLPHRPAAGLLVDDQQGRTAGVGSGADFVVLGGGNANRFDALPKGIEKGKNANAFLGGVRLWETEPRSRKLKWRVM